MVEVADCLSWPTCLRPKADKRNSGLAENRVSNHLQVEPSYEHIDFTWGIDASTRVYPAVLDLLRMYP